MTARTPVYIDSGKLHVFEDGDTLPPWLLPSSMAWENLTGVPAGLTELAALTGPGYAKVDSAGAWSVQAAIPQADVSGLTTALAGLQPISARLTAIAGLTDTAGWLHDDGSGNWALTTPTKSDVGLGSVENTALSTWAGSTNLTALGTISTGTWHGTAIMDSYIASAAAWNAKEGWLGNPTIAGQVLASTISGTRFWVSLPNPSTTTPLMDGTAAVGTGITWARADHVHPTDTTRLAATAQAVDSAKLGGQLPSYYALASAIPAASTTTPAALGTAAVGTGITWARADHVHAMPTAFQVGAEPALGSPSASGYLLSSTSAGVRSWVAPYSLPTATASVLGGVKVGTGLSISSGALSVSYGAAAGTACAGNDSRLSDSRAPTAHALDGSLHTISGKAAGQALLATSATAFGFATISGDATLSGSGALTLASLLTAGSAGSSTSVPVLTWDAKGRLTAVGSAAISIPHAQISDWSTYINQPLLTTSSPTFATVTGNLTGTASNANQLGGVAADYFVQGSGNNWGVRTANLPGSSTALTQGLKSGFYDNDGTNGSGTPTGGWYHMIVNAHTNSYSGNQYQWELAAGFWDEDLYSRKINPGSASAWRKLLHAGNYSSFNNFSSGLSTTTLTASTSVSTPSFIENGTALSSKYLGINASIPSSRISDWGTYINQPLLTTSSPTFATITGDLTGTASNASALGGVAADYFVQGQNSSRTQVLSNAVTSQSQLFKSGFYSSSMWTDAPVASTWTHLIHTQYGNDGGSANNWSFDIAANFGSAATPGSPEAYYVRAIANGISTGWRTLIHSANYASFNNFTSGVTTTTLTASGLITANGGITGNLTGNASTATKATYVNITENTTANAGFAVLWAGTESTGDVYGTLSKLAFNPSTGVLTASGGFSGNLTGNAATASAVVWTGITSKPDGIDNTGVHRLYRADGTDGYWLSHSWSNVCASYFGHNSWYLTASNSQNVSQAGISTVLVDYAGLSVNSLQLGGVAASSYLLASTASSTYLPLGGTASNASALGGVAADYFVQGSNSTRTTLLAGAVTSQSQLFKSGFYCSPTWTDAPVASTWTHLIHSQYAGDGGTANNWSFDIAANFGSAAVPGSPEGYYIRAIANSISTGWRQLIHSANYPSFNNFTSGLSTTTLTASGLITANGGITGNLTGNASTASAVAWTGITSKPDGIDNRGAARLYRGDGTDGYWLSHSWSNVCAPYFGSNSWYLTCSNSQNVSQNGIHTVLVDYAGLSVNSLQLGGVAASSYLLSSTASSTYLPLGGTASNASALGGKSPNWYLPGGQYSIPGNAGATDYTLLFTVVFSSQYQGFNNEAYISGRYNASRYSIAIGNDTNTANVYVSKFGSPFNDAGCIKYIVTNTSSYHNTVKVYLVRGSWDYYNNYSFSNCTGSYDSYAENSSPTPTTADPGVIAPTLSTFGYNTIANTVTASGFVEGGTALSSKYLGIGASIPHTQISDWGTYINQPLLTTSSPTFAGQTINGNSLITGYVDLVGNLNLRSGAGILNSSGDGWNQWLDRNGGSPIITATGGFVGNLSGNANTATTATNALSLGGIAASSYVVASGTSAQFLKADGSLDSNEYVKSFSVFPPLTISGSAYVKLAQLPVNPYGGLFEINLTIYSNNSMTSGMPTVTMVDFSTTNAAINVLARTLNTDYGGAKYGYIINGDYVELWTKLDSPWWNEFRVEVNSNSNEPGNNVGTLAYQNTDPGITFVANVIKYDDRYLPLSGGTVSGSITSTNYKVSALNNAPSSSTDFGTVGDIRWTDGYIYLCTATNTWKRAALTTW